MGGRRRPADARVGDAHPRVERALLAPVPPLRYGRPTADTPPAPATSRRPHA